MSRLLTAGALPVLGLLVNAFTWGVSWWPLRHLESAGLHPLWATTLLYAVASVVMIAWRPSGLRELFNAPALWVILLASGGTNACFNWAVTVGEVTRVVLLFYLAPLWMVLLARWLLGERLHAGVWLRVALALAGAAIVLLAQPADAVASARPPSALADALALIGGVLFALFNVMLRREADRPETGRALAMFLGGVLVPGAVALVATASGGDVAWPPVQQGAWLGWIWPLLALAGAFLLANLALQYGAARLPSQITAVVMPSEVVFAAVSAAWLAGEVLSGAALLGGALILAATLLAALPQRPVSAAG